MTRERRLKFTTFAAVLALSVAAGQGASAALADDPAATYLTDAQKYLDKGDLKAAQIQLRNAVRANPANGAARLKLGLVHLRLGDAASAEKELKFALERQVDPALVVPALARAYLMQNKTEALLKEFPPGRFANDVEAELDVSRGYALIGLKRLDEADASMREAIKLAPQSAAAYLGLAYLMRARGDLADGEREVDKALAIAPSRTDAHLLKGEFRRLDRDADSALAEFNTVLKQEPGNQQALLSRAAIYVDRNDRAAAEKDIAAVLKVSPKLVQANYLRALLQARNQQIDAAAETLQGISSAFVNFPAGFYLFGAVKYAQGQLEQAEANLNKYLAQEPKDVRAARLLASIALRQNAPQRAIDLLNQALAQSPNDAQLLGMLGSAYVAAGKPDAAAEALEKAVAVNPSDAVAHQRLGLTALQAGKTDEAIGELEKSLKLSTSPGEAALTLAIVHMRAGRFDEAQQVVDDLRQRLPDSPLPQNLAGMILMARGDLEGARKTFEELAKAHPESQHARLNLGQVLRAQNKPAEAVAAYEAVLKADPRNIAAYMALADMAQQEKRYADALGYLERAQKEVPNAPDPVLKAIDVALLQQDTAKALAGAKRYQQIGPKAAGLDVLGRVQLAAGNVNEAVATYRQLTADAPASAAAHHRLAQALMAAKDDAAARAELEQAISLDPRFSQAAIDLAALTLRKEGFDSAWKVASEYRKKQPQSPAADLLAADVLATGKRYADAAELYRSALKKQPDTQTALRLSQAETLAGQPQKAVSTLQDWIAAHPDDRAAEFGLAGSYISLARYPDAIKLYEKLLPNDQKSPVLLNNLAWLYQKTNDPRALDFAERALTAAPDSADIKDTAGWILVERGDPAKGLEYLRDAAAKLPKSQATQYHLALAYAKLGQQTEARAILERITGTPEEFAEKADAEKLLSRLRKG